MPLNKAALFCFKMKKLILIVCSMFIYSQIIAALLYIYWIEKFNQNFFKNIKTSKFIFLTSTTKLSSFITKYNFIVVKIQWILRNFDIV